MRWHFVPQISVQCALGPSRHAVKGCWQTLQMAAFSWLCLGLRLAMGTSGAARLRGAAPIFAACFALRRAAAGAPLGGRMGPARSELACTAAADPAGRGAAGASEAKRAWRLAGRTMSLSQHS